MSLDAVVPAVEQAERSRAVDLLQRFLCLPLALEHEAQAVEDEQQVVAHRLLVERVGRRLEKTGYNRLASHRGRSGSPTMREHHVARLASGEVRVPDRASYDVEEDKL